jgi:hypothetical protein
MNGSTKNYVEINKGKKVKKNKTYASHYFEVWRSGNINPYILKASRRLM